ncbi:hypothetical protein QA612_02675 [Evansella sp. AB-P1]|uniref:hypothetical protein n=1 Tax=Evansella sp. AB-P1 TaxID=3037653 RepID=UPI00241FFF0D|nr:hypothetical protein [Evansella sp. AB-P1]MDG5786379.1 hypothetical protein [Evansella sp. AB-P1]
MSFCPVCNGMEKINKKCPSCQTIMEDEGRLHDYYDDYSAYESIDLMKLEDGIKNDNEEHLCPHLLLCKECLKDEVILVNEDI